jgi:ribosomal protein L11 methyltransferase
MKSRSRTAPAASPRDVWALAVVTAPEAEDAVGELLHGLTGEAAIATHDRITGRSTVVVYLADAARMTTRLRAELREGLGRIAACGLDTGLGRISFRRVPPTDWRESWKKHFKPLAIGKQLLVRPSWVRRRLSPGQAELVLDPGLSFGTGQHPTTEFCLREVVRLRPRKTRQGTEKTPSLLDVGTGSGILALAAARLGYEPVEAFDFDPEAADVARENAADNGLAKQVTLACRDVAKLSLRPKQRFDVVCANLQADLLLRHVERLVAQVKPGGHLVLAGILSTEFATVRERFEGKGASLRFVRSGTRREWTSGSFAKPRATGSDPYC